MRDEEYYPWQIIWSQAQIRWLLNPLARNAIKLGQWPFSIQSDALAHSNVSHHASFELISLIKAELEARLNIIGRDKYLILARYYDEYTDEEISRAFNIEVNAVNRRIKRALRYIAGARKQIAYDDWIKNGWKEFPNSPKVPCVS
jgi:DNA-directed RNA polymerase specialized sigma subunit